MRPTLLTRIRLTAAVVTVCLFCSAKAQDVIVYSATPGGIAAAVSAAKGGREVLLIEPTDRIGGLLTSGLSYSDFRSFEALTGFYHDLARRVVEHYTERYGADSAQVRDSFRGVLAEPRVNLRVLEKMIAELPDITVVTGERLLEVETGPYQMGRRSLLSLTTVSASGETTTHRGKFFIDGSYEGDLMAAAGESYHVGRESRAQYGEPMAGDAQGRADGQVQGYNLRLIMTQVEEKKLMAEAPEGYDREDFVGVLQHFESGKLKKVFDSGHHGIYRAHLPLLPNGKTDVNDTPHAPVRLSMPDINDAYPEASHEERQEIIRAHFYYNVGLLHFLQHDDAVPAAIREDARSWGWCRDEFTETGGLPPKLYIREARRMVGQHVFTGNDTTQLPDDARGVLHRDSIAIGDYVHNCHGTGREGTRYEGKHSGEFYKPVPPYQIPSGVIIPQKTVNLLVPVACSASHFGFGALRLEPIWSSLGQAAGWAAHVALDQAVPVQEIDIPRLQSLLHGDRSATIYVSDVPPDHPDFAAVQWFGTLGGLHGLAPADQPKPVPIVGQYTQAHPGHAAGLELLLEKKLRERWQELVPLEEAISADRRGEWIRRAFERTHAP
jgi:hypothetical protein